MADAGVAVMAVAQAIVSTQRQAVLEMAQKLMIEKIARLRAMQSFNVALFPLLERSDQVAGILPVASGIAGIHCGHFVADQSCDITGNIRAEPDMTVGIQTVVLIIQPQQQLQSLAV